jgi:predicted adenylyl cyclase CyaB
VAVGSPNIGLVGLPGINVELKAPDPDPQRSLARCREIGAEDRGLLIQRDTYFEASTGRLKLREQEGSAPHLIAYDRPDLQGRRESRYEVTDIERPEELRAVLAAALGIRVGVAKRRRLFRWEGVRIHLDMVDGLGTFIEFEAIVAAHWELARKHRQVDKLRQIFGIQETDIVAVGYGELLLAANDLEAEDESVELRA